MKVVIDTNVLITCFWKGSVFRSLVQKSNLELYAPAYALEEIRKHREEIRKKVRLPLVEFAKTLQDLHMLVTFVSLHEYSQHFSEVLAIAKHFPHSENEILNDIDFLALAVHLDCLLWSNDALLKRQPLVSVVTTKEFILLLAEI